MFAVQTLAHTALDCRICPPSPLLSDGEQATKGLFNHIDEEIPAFRGFEKLGMPEHPANSFSDSLMGQAQQGPGKRICLYWNSSQPSESISS
jgi:hypothetical protein